MHVRWLLVSEVVTIFFFLILAFLRSLPSFTYSVNKYVDLFSLFFMCACVVFFVLFVCFFSDVFHLQMSRNTPD